VIVVGRVLTLNNDNVVLNNVKFSTSVVATEFRIVVYPRVIAGTEVVVFLPKVTNAVVSFDVVSAVAALDSAGGVLASDDMPTEVKVVNVKVVNRAVVAGTVLSNADDEYFLDVATMVVSDCVPPVELLLAAFVCC